MFRVLLLLSAMLLAGCSSFEAAAPPSGQGGLIYVYRADQVIHGEDADDTRFYIDDRKVFDLDQSGYSFAYVPSGPHELMERAPNSDDKPETWIHQPIVVQAGETRYFRCCSIVFPGGIDFTESAAFVEMPARLALKDLWRMHARRPYD